MSSPLTFVSEKLLESAVVGADGTVHYRTSTMRGFARRKTTTVTAASGLVGSIDWRAKTFSIGVHTNTNKNNQITIHLRERDWSWAGQTYKFKYHHSHTELLATPTSGDATAVRFTVYQSHLVHADVPASIRFPEDMPDETARMFVLLAILQMELHRLDKEMIVEGAELSVHVIELLAG
ncbi:hypothetical protein DFH09DRAFT_1316791 [Mycena vulgaris]|nr:hypothetical protein DFH09DRAFT_1316791 [Mycena vulgaris]